MAIKRSSGEYAWAWGHVGVWAIVGVLFVSSSGNSSRVPLAANAEQVVEEEDPPMYFAGTLRDDAGDPVAGARITVWDDMPNHWKIEHEVDEVITDVNGGFRLHTGFYAVEVAVRSEIGTMTYPGNPYYDRVPLPLLRRKRQDLVLMRWAEVCGKVVDGETGEAVREFRVHFRTSKCHLPRKYESKKGRFTESKVTPGTVTVTVMAHGYAPRVIYDISAVPCSKIDIGQVRMRRGPTLKGRVLSASNGEPLVGALVRFRCIRTHAIVSYPPDDLSVTTDARGEFSVSNTPILPLELYTSAEKPKHRHVRIGDVDMSLARDGVLEAVFYVKAETGQLKGQD